MSQISHPVEKVAVALGSPLDGEVGSGARADERKRERVWLVVGMVAMDVAMLVLAFFLAYLARGHFEPFVTEPITLNNGLPVLAVLVLGYLALYHLHGLYHATNLFGGSGEYQRIFSATTTGIVFTLFVSAVYDPLTITPGWLVTLWAFTLTGGLLGRFVVRRIVYANRRLGRFVERSIVLGANSEGLAIAEQLCENRASGAAIIGFVDDSIEAGKEPLPGVPVLGGSQEFTSLVKRYNVDSVVVADPAILRENLLKDDGALAALRNVEIQMAWGAFELLTTGLRIREEGFVPLVVLNKTRISGVHWLLKEILDRLCSAAAIVLLMPALALMAIIIKLDSKGPVFHRRRVVGVGRREFDAFKLRTMKTEGDELLNEAQKREWAEHGKIKNDPRITKLGLFLRRSSLDELPQLWNVLRGEMSIVGPRMLTMQELEKFGKWQHCLLTVKPGLTGLWQVSGRSDLSYEDRVRMDLHYIRNHTIWLDLQLLLQTFPALISRKGAY